MTNITDTVLAIALKDLIADQIVKRQSYDEIPNITKIITNMLCPIAKNVITIINNVNTIDFIRYRNQQLPVGKNYNQDFCRVIV